MTYFQNWKKFEYSYKLGKSPCAIPWMVYSIDPAGMELNWTDDSRTGYITGDDINLDTWLSAISGAILTEVYSIYISRISSLYLSLSLSSPIRKNYSGAFVNSILIATCNQKECKIYYHGGNMNIQIHWKWVWLSCLW